MAKSKALTKIGGVEMKKENAPELLKILNKKIKDIKGDDKCADPVGDTSISGVGTLSNLTPMQLIQARARVNAISKAFDEAKENMVAEGITVGKEEFELSGFSKEQLIESINRQYSIKSQKETLEKLNRFREVAKKYITEDQKFEEDIKDMAELFSK